MIFWAGWAVGATVSFWYTVWLLSLPREQKPDDEALRAVEDMLHEHWKALARLGKNG